MKKTPIILAVISLSSLCYGALKDNLISYWAFEQASGNFSDSHGSNTLVTDNDPTYQQIGINDYCGDWNGSADYATCSSSDWNFGTGAYSISVWINADANSTGQTVLRFEDSSGVTSDDIWTGIYFGSGTINSHARTSSGGWVGVNGPAVNTGSWYHCVFTRDASGNIEFYVNGSSQGTNTGANFNATTSGKLWTGRDAIGNYYNGRFDELAVWDKEVSSTEVTEIYNSGSGKFYADWDAVLPSPATYYIDTDVAGGSRDGSSWANAFIDLNEWRDWAVDSSDPITRNETWTVNLRGTAADVNVPVSLDIPTDANHTIALVGDWTTDANDDSYFHVEGSNTSFWVIDTNYLDVNGVQFICSAVDGPTDYLIDVNGVAADNRIRFEHCYFSGGQYNIFSDDTDLLLTLTDIVGLDPNAVYDCNLAPASLTVNDYYFPFAGTQQDVNLPDSITSSGSTTGRPFSASMNGEFE